MQPPSKGTKVYTRLDTRTGREITVRKRRGVFTVYVNNQEHEQFNTQAEAMAVADRLTESQPGIRQ